VPLRDSGEWALGPMSRKPCDRLPRQLEGETTDAYFTRSELTNLGPDAAKAARGIGAITPSDHREGMALFSVFRHTEAPV